jgi:hypothetical protein
MGYMELELYFEVFWLCTPLSVSIAFVWLETVRRVLCGILVWATLSVMKIV